VKYLFEIASESVCKSERKFERRRISARLERDDGLARHSTGLGERGLRQFSAQLSKVTDLVADRDVAHARSRQ